MKIEFNSQQSITFLLGLLHLATGKPDCRYIKDHVDNLVTPVRMLFETRAKQTGETVPDETALRASVLANQARIVSMFHLAHHEDPLGMDIPDGILKGAIGHAPENFDAYMRDPDARKNHPGAPTESVLALAGRVLELLDAPPHTQETSFTITTGRLVVSDPCYEDSTSDANCFAGAAKNGEWTARFIPDGQDGRRRRSAFGGRRTARLVAFHKDHEGDPPTDNGDTLCVDSGQIFAGDAGSYPRPGESRETFYAACCKASGAPYALGGTIKTKDGGSSGVCTASGDGDGGYRLLRAEDGGETTHIIVEFYGDRDE